MTHSIDAMHMPFFLFELHGSLLKCRVSTGAVLHFGTLIRSNMVEVLYSVLLLGAIWQSRSVISFPYLMYMYISFLCFIYISLSIFLE